MIRASRVVGVSLLALLISVSAKAQTDTDAAALEIQSLDAQAREVCSAEQVDAVQLQVQACMGGPEVCLGYRSDACFAKELGQTPDGSVEPFACITECTVLKFGPCSYLYKDLIASCNGQTQGTVNSTETSQPEDVPSAECPGEHRVKVGDVCECELGYQIDLDAGGCTFITSGAGLDSETVEKINDATAGLIDKPNSVDVVEITVAGALVKLGLARNPLARGSYRFTTDGVHFYNSLADALSGSHLGQRFVNGVRGGLSKLSLFNWFSGGYNGDDRKGKFDIAREVANDDLDATRHRLLSHLKYRNDFLNGMAAYMDQRDAGLSAQDIASGYQDSDAEIERFTSRMHISVSNRTKKLSQEDQQRVDAEYKNQLYESFEDGYQRYQLYKQIK